MSEHVDIHAISILEIRHRTESQLFGRFRASKLTQIITRDLEHGTYRGQVNIIDFIVATITLDSGFIRFARKLECSAINTLHTHYRTLDKRPFLGNACHVQLGDDSSIFRSAASDALVIRTCPKHSPDNQGFCNLEPFLNQPPIHIKPSPHS